MKKITPFLLTALSVLICTACPAQSTQQAIKKDPSYSGCYYRSYPAPADDQVKEAPAGYEPFYISHYGRHGSRWVSDQGIYSRASGLLEKAATANVLSAKGKDLLEKIRIICEDAAFRGGDLSPKGVMEHKGIAKRMYRNYPEVFTSKDGKSVKVSSIATLSPRCILSMAAFNEGLKEEDSCLELSREASKRYLPYMHNYEYTDGIYKASEAAGDSLIRAWTEPSRFLHSIISDDRFIHDQIADPDMALFDFFHIASDMQCVDYLGIDLYPFFTEKELYLSWKALNAHTYMTEGPSFRYGDLLMKNAKALVRNIVETADDVIAGKNPYSAHLRFGHESNIVPFMALIEVESVKARTTAEKAHKCWNISEICPMATNMQFIFFRAPSGNVKVRVLHNEQDACLPIDGGPFYDWNVLRPYLMEKAAL